MSVGELEELKK
jgi:hypothetical protein